MIKRSGVEIVNPKAGNVAIAKQTIDICKNKQYIYSKDSIYTVVDITQSLDAALEGTVYYPADSLIETKTTYSFPTFEIVNETTAQAAVRLASLGKTDIVALNFAAARNQGGGFLHGAMAQEEDLCRCSGLYACLKKKPLFYNANILCEDTYYTDGIIYSPKVPFIRDEHNVLLEIPFELSIVTSPAPNLSGVNKEGLSSFLKGILRERAIKILKVASHHGHKNIILGAWGCGAFGNDPVMVAEAFKLALEKVPHFNHICFAVYDTRVPTHLFDTFKEVFAEK